MMSRCRLLWVVAAEKELAQFGKGLAKRSTDLHTEANTHKASEKAGGRP